MGELFIQLFHYANKAILNQRMEPVIGCLESAIEFLEDCGGLLEKERKREKGFWREFPVLVDWEKCGEMISQ